MVRFQCSGRRDYLISWNPLSIWSWGIPGEYDIELGVGG